MIELKKVLFDDDIMILALLLLLIVGIVVIGLGYIFRNSEQI